MRRVFVAIAMPLEVSLQLEKLQRGLAGARWVRPDGFHLTLAFLGKVDEDRLEDVDSALNEARGKKFELRLAGLGHFGDEDPRAVWAAVQPSDPLNALQKRVQTSLRQARFSPDAKRFTPHVTLGRLNYTPPDKLGRYIARHGLFSAGPFQVTEMTLFESLLSDQAAIYQPLETYSLK